MSPLPIARACGSCTLCCFTHEVDDTTKGYEWCQSCDQDGARCRVYDQRPQGCRDFSCLWLMGLPGTNEGDRPDRTGIVLVVPKAGHERLLDPGTGAAVLLVLAFERCRGTADTPIARDLLARVVRAGKAVVIVYDGQLRRILCPSGRILTPG